MSNVTHGSFGSNPTAPKEYLIRRDKEQPLSFSGVQIAKSVRKVNPLADLLSDEIEAAVYRTRGGKFITSLIRSPALLTGLGYDPSEQVARGGYNKAAVFESLTEAMDWFRPGKLTDDIREQLGLNDPIRIE